MCNLPVSDEKLVQYTPQPKHSLTEVQPRQQDSSFAMDLALLLREQSEGLAGKKLSIVCISGWAQMTDSITVKAIYCAWPDM